MNVTGTCKINGCGANCYEYNEYCDNHRCEFTTTEIEVSMKNVAVNKGPVEADTAPAATIASGHQGAERYAPRLMAGII